MDLQTWAGGILVACTLVLLFMQIIRPCIRRIAFAGVGAERPAGYPECLWKARAWLEAEVVLYERRLVELQGRIKAAFNN